MVADDPIDELDNLDGRPTSVNRRQLLRAGGLALTVGLAGCSDSNTVETVTSEGGQNGTSTVVGVERRTRAGTPESAPSEAQEQANTGTRTSTPVAREDVIWLLDFTYSQSSRQMQATVYNPTEQDYAYDLRFFCFNSNGYVVYYTTVEAEESTGAGYEGYYTATVPEYVADRIQYYSVFYRPDDYTEYAGLYEQPSNRPAPPSPFYNDQVSNPGQYATATVASFTEGSSYRAELITRVQNTHNETLYVQHEVALASNGGITLASDTGFVFPLRPQQTARFVSSVTPSDYEFSDVATTNAQISSATVMRLPPSTDVFEEVDRDTIDGELQVELRNTASVPVGAYGVIRWLRGGDLIGVDLASTGDSYTQPSASDVDPGERFVLDFGADRRQGDSAYRATDYRLALFTNNTLLVNYVDGDSGESYIDVAEPFDPRSSTFGSRTGVSSLIEKLR